MPPLGHVGPTEKVFSIFVNSPHGGQSVVAVRFFGEMVHRKTSVSDILTSHRPLNGLAVCCRRPMKADGKTIQTTDCKVRSVQMDGLVDPGCFSNFAPASPLKWPRPLSPLPESSRLPALCQGALAWTCPDRNSMK